ncbi:uncharacterized protein LOC130990498 [Salvia miltiorrhiza]|uniref:uncharacterized protein LOC130990498 n=1 Tax=Salvia miltiorrhiza TaxID=226208 RepID=UPI0025AB81CB|nr:uncharacterized protein LOC130990498 [Salvia miltiorrhiza]
MVQNREFIALEERVNRLESLLGTPPETSARVAVFERMREAEIVLDTIQASVVDVRKSMQDLPGFVESRIVSCEEDVNNQVEELSMKVERLLDEMHVMKQAMRSTSKVRIPDPKSFEGTRSSKELENFLWDMESYFQAAHVADEEKVSITTMYLSGDAKLWWRSRQSGENHAQNRIEMDALRKLKHSGSVREYVKEFSSLMLDIREMSEEDKLFNFLARLQTWAQTELRRQGVKDLSSAIAAVDSLVDYKTMGSTESGQKKKETGKGKEKKKKGKDGWKKKKANNGNAGGSKDSSQQNGGEKRRGCFICNGDHCMRDCPKKVKLNALVAESDKESDVGAPRMNPLQLLSTIQGDAKSDYGLIRIKAVNTEAKPVLGVGDVDLQIDAWKGSCSLMAVPLDDFEIILGMEFLKMAKVPVMAHVGGIMILDERCPTFVKGEFLAERKSYGLISALQLKKGLKQGVPTYLAAMVEIKPGVSQEVPDAVAELLDEFKDVMPEELPKELSPRRATDHRIELEPGARPPAQAPYCMSPSELAELRKQLDELLLAGLVQPSKAPYGSPVLFQRKQDGSLRFCIDYRALNKVTIKNKYPIPNAFDLFDKLSRASLYTKIDLQFGYWQVRIAPGDEAKTTCVTRYGSFEFLVMPFGFTNAPATFCNLMNDVLYEFLDRFVVVYLDDIVIYSDSLNEHLLHMRVVFLKLLENKLYAKKEKCEFCRNSITFLGYVIGQWQIKMDRKKVQAVLDWPVPSKVAEMRSFLGLANYYRRFIEGYSKIANPLTDLLKKDVVWKWTEACQCAFDELKHKLSTEPVLRLPIFDEPFEVQVDASDRAIRGVLVQNKHPLAYESRKLKDCEYRYSTHEKEMTAVIHCLEVWKHYLLGTKFTVVTDNVANTYFKTQKSSHQSKHVGKSTWGSLISIGSSESNKDNAGPDPVEKSDWRQVGHHKQKEGGTHAPNDKDARVSLPQRDTHSNPFAVLDDLNIADSLVNDPNIVPERHDTQPLPKGPFEDHAHPSESLSPRQPSPSSAVILHQVLPEAQPGSSPDQHEPSDGTLPAVDLALTGQPGTAMMEDSPIPRGRGRPKGTTKKGRVSNSSIKHRLRRIIKNGMEMSKSRADGAVLQGAGAVIVSSPPVEFLNKVQHAQDGGATLQNFVIHSSSDVARAMSAVVSKRWGDMLDDDDSLDEDESLNIFS